MNVIDRWQEAESLFNAALERKPEEREAFLASACSDPDLLAAVKRLLNEDASSEGAFDRSSSRFARMLGELVSEPPEESLLGTTVGPYKILEVLGQGGMGKVYMAEDARLGRKVALKFVSGGIADRSDSLRRFMTEARATSALNHPNIVTIHDAGRAESISYIAVEYIEGQTLRQRMQQPLSLPEVLDISIQVARALAAAHTAGVIHRDIKPENIMVRGDGLVKVVDFGLAKLMRSSLLNGGVGPASLEGAGTIPGAILGTVFYMSPEQARGEELDARTDVFSLGVVMYEVLAGRKPFRGNTLPDFLEALMHQEPSPIPGLDDNAGCQAQSTINRAVAKDRNHRYQSAAQFAADLEQAMVDIDGMPDAKTSSLPSRSRRSRSFGRSRQIDKSTLIWSKAVAWRGRWLSSKQAQRVRITVAAILAFLLAAGTVREVLRKGPKPGPFAAEVSIERLTNSGDARLATLSQDKRLLAYATQDEKGGSLWVREMSSGTERRLVGPDQFTFWGLAFLPDGSQIYYVVLYGYSSGVLFRVPLTGGAPIRIRENVTSGVSFSPDGGQFAFASKSGKDLMIGETAGADARILATLEDDEMWLDPAWSPDGKTIAAGVTQISAEAQYLVAVSTGSGAVSRIGADQWVRVNSEAWLQNGSGLIICAADRDSQLFQIWFVPYPQGAARRITNDTNEYAGVTLAGDGKSIVSVQNAGTTDIWVMNPGDQNSAQRIPSGSHNSPAVNVAWTGDGRILYTAGLRERNDIWVMDSDGENQHRLTSGPGLKGSPSVSPDNRFIVFGSDAGGHQAVWRMDIDGTNPIRLSPGDGCFDWPQCTPDGNWVTYQSFAADAGSRLWKVSIDGGEPIRITDYYSNEPALSPDGTEIACLVGDDRRPDLGFIPIGGGKPERVIHLPPNGRTHKWRWNKLEGLTGIIDDYKHPPNIYRFLLNGGQPEQLTFFSDRQHLTSYDWSQQGRVVLSRASNVRDVVRIAESGRP
jgi:serine/threonine protein kinase/Tol biopolymer transport system component